MNYCGGCNWILASIEKLMFGRKPKIYHILELINLSLGKNLDYRIKKRSKLILSIFIFKFLRYKCGKRFWIENINNDKT